MTLAWIFLFIAGAFEIGWPLGFKLFDKSGHIVYLALSIVSMAVSGFFLYHAQKSIPIGTAYAVWTGIGATGTFLIGLFFFDDKLAFARCFGVFCIIVGVITLELSERHGADSRKPSVVTTGQDER